MECEVCHQQFPEEFYIPFHCNGTTRIVDPWCVKHEIERVHGLPPGSYVFTGEWTTKTVNEYMDWKAKQPAPPETEATDV